MGCRIGGNLSNQLLVILIVRITMDVAHRIIEVIDAILVTVAALPFLFPGAVVVDDVVEPLVLDVEEAIAAPATKAVKRGRPSRWACPNRLIRRESACRAGSKRFRAPQDCKSGSANRHGSLANSNSSSIRIRVPKAGGASSGACPIRHDHGQAFRAETI